MKLKDILKVGDYRQNEWNEIIIDEDLEIDIDIEKVKRSLPSLNLFDYTLPQQRAGYIDVDWHKMQEDIAQAIAKADILKVKPC